jgi:Family of unknown function (DUF6284)
MRSIAAGHADDAPTVHVLDDEREPTDAELSAIEKEMPAILAGVDLLDVQITFMDRDRTELTARRTRRARNRLMTARRDLTNRQAFPLGGAA